MLKRLSTTHTIAHAMMAEEAEMNPEDGVQRWIRSRFHISEDGRRLAYTGMCMHVLGIPMPFPYI